MDSSGQIVSTLSYNRVTTTSTPTDLATEYKSAISGNTFVDEIYLNLDTNAIAQVDRFTLSGTLAVGDTVTVTIEDADGNEFDYVHVAKSTSIQAAAAAIAALINLDDDVAAVSSFASSTGTVTITSATPGRAFTTTTGKTGTVTVSSATTITANAGTPKKRKVAQAEWTTGVSADGSLTVTGVVKFYDGAAVPVQVQSQSTAPYKHPRTIDAVRTAQGA